MSTLLIVLGSLLVVSLPCYIVARIRTNSDKMVLTTGRLDITLLMICPILVVLGWVLYQSATLQTIGIILWVVAGISFALSVMHSIMENKGSVWNMCWSAGAKIFILISTFVFVIVSIVALLTYLVFYLLKELGKSDEKVASAEPHRFSLPNYRKFMYAYVGRKFPEEKEKVEVEDVEAVEIVHKK